MRLAIFFRKKKDEQRVATATGWRLRTFRFFSPSWVGWLVGWKGGSSLFFSNSKCWLQGKHKAPKSLGRFVGDDKLPTQLCGDEHFIHNEIRIPSLNKQDSMESIRVFFFFVAELVGWCLKDSHETGTWRFGSDDFPFFKFLVIFRLNQPLILQEIGQP